MIAVRLECRELAARSALWPWMAAGLTRIEDLAALHRPMYHITCPSRARPHARSQVLARLSQSDVPDNRPLSGAFAGRVLL